MKTTKPLIWEWNKKSIELSKLDDAQLEIIKQTVTKSKHNWFGHKRQVWLDNVNTILNSRSNYRVNKLSQDIALRRKIGVYKYVQNSIIDKIK